MSVTGAALPTREYLYEDFVEQCGVQLYASGVPRIMWRTAYRKLTQNILDVGSAFMCCHVESAIEDPAILIAKRPLGFIDELDSYDNVDAFDDDDDRELWVLDHSFTFRAREARKQIAGNAALRKRLMNMLVSGPHQMDDGSSDATTAAASSTDEDSAVKEKLQGEIETERIMAKLWTKANHYRITTESQLDEEACWYLPDEVGVSVQPCLTQEEENVAMAPIFFPPSGLAFQLMWVVGRCEEDDVIQTCVRRSQRHSSSIIRIRTVWGDDDDRHATAEYAARVYEKYQSALAKSTSGADRRSAYVKVASHPQKGYTPHMKRVYTDLELVKKYLTLPGWILVEDPRDCCDVAWLSEYNPHVSSVVTDVGFVSQFPNEIEFCHKMKMARTLRSFWGTSATWLPLTFDANTELALFLAEYESRAENHEDNLWIVKPHCMARSMDMVVSDDRTLLLRLGETGPKLISKYISNPCTFRGRKFDMRFVVLVRSFVPLEIYLYDIFWLRFAALPFSLTDFDEYDKHWTVMNYGANADKLLQIHYNDFIPEFDTERVAAGSDETWETCHKRIAAMIYDAFVAIASTHGADLQPGRHIQARATYGIDVMLNDALDPKLLEITYSPDCERACKYHPHFFNDVFSTLFDGRPRGCNLLPL